MIPNNMNALNEWKKLKQGKGKNNMSIMGKNYYDVLCESDDEAEAETETSSPSGITAKNDSDDGFFENLRKRQSVGVVVNDEGKTKQQHSAFNDDNKTKNHILVDTTSILLRNLQRDHHTGDDDIPELVWNTSPTSVLTLPSEEKDNNTPKIVAMHEQKETTDDDNSKADPMGFLLNELEQELHEVIDMLVKEDMVEAEDAKVYISDSSSSSSSSNTIGKSRVGFRFIISMVMMFLVFIPAWCIYDGNMIDMQHITSITGNLNDMMHQYHPNRLLQDQDSMPQVSHRRQDRLAAEMQEKESRMTLLKLQYHDVEVQPNNMSRYQRLQEFYYSLQNNYFVTKDAQQTEQRQFVVAPVMESLVSIFTSNTMIPHMLQQIKQGIQYTRDEVTSKMEYFTDLVMEQLVSPATVMRFQMMYNVIKTMAELTQKEFSMISGDIKLRITATAKGWTSQIIATIGTVAQQVMSTVGTSSAALSEYITSSAKSVWCQIDYYANHIVHHMNRVTKRLASTNAEIQTKSHNLLFGQEDSVKHIGTATKTILSQMDQQASAITQQVKHVTQTLALDNAEIQAKTNKIVGGTTLRESFHHIQGTTFGRRASRILSTMIRTNAPMHT